MRIKNFKVEKPNGEIALNIEVNEVGLNKLELEKDKIEESFSKDLILKFIDYIFGAADDYVLKRKYYGYKLEADVMFNNEVVNIVRTIEGQTQFLVDGIIYKFREYKNEFGIKRNYCRRQIILAENRENFFYKDEIFDLIELLKLNNLMEDVKSIYEIYLENKDNFDDFTEKNEEEISNKVLQFETKKKKYKKIFDKYNRFLQAVIEKLFNEKKEIILDLKIEPKYFLKNKSVIEISCSENIENLKRILIDLLIFRYNDKMKILVLGEKYFNKVSETERNILIEIAEKIALKCNKQLII